VELFRASGKPAVLFAETFGEFLPAHGAYHLATAFERVVLQPSGEVAVAGLAVEAPFLREALEKLEVTPRFDARGEYKDAADLFTRDGFSEPSREALEALLASLLATFREGVVQGRGLPPTRCAPSWTGVPSTPGTPWPWGWWMSWDTWTRPGMPLEARVGPGTAALSLGDYHLRGGRAWNRGPRIAVVYGLGIIQRGRSGYDPLSGEGVMGASTVADALRAATEDDRVRAIVFRVDSPGGSWVASDRIRREILRARDQGKPVVVSMGNAAASGGYLVSSGADRIVAHPTTLTGIHRRGGGALRLGGVLPASGDLVGPGAGGGVRGVDGGGGGFHRGGVGALPGHPGPDLPGVRGAGGGGPGHGAGAGGRRGPGSGLDGAGRPGAGPGGRAGGLRHRPGRGPGAGGAGPRRPDPPGGVSGRAHPLPAPHGRRMGAPGLPWNGLPPSPGGRAGAGSLGPGGRSHVGWVPDRGGPVRMPLLRLEGR
jgi:ClpP class serine protease